MFTSLDVHNTDKVQVSHKKSNDWTILIISVPKNFLTYICHENCYEIK